MPRVVLEIDVSEGFARYVEDNNYSGLCEFFKAMIAEGGTELGLWFFLPEDIKIVCKEFATGDIDD